MADLRGSRADAARRKAQEKFAATKQRDADVRKDRDKALAAAVAKTERLKALRLAKEAADREAGTPPKKSSTSGRSH
ncbi:MAG: hypothetical protein ACM3N5_06075 [Candidatus Eiseniibacteriota bacterium]